MLSLKKNAKKFVALLFFEAVLLFRPQRNKTGTDFIQPLVNSVPALHFWNCSRKIA